MHSFNSPRPSHPLGPPPLPLVSPQPLCVDRRPPRRERTAPHCECSRVGTFIDARGCSRGCGTDVWHRGVVRGAGRFNETRPHHPFRARSARETSLLRIEMHPPFSSPGSRVARLRARGRRCDFSVAAFPRSTNVGLDTPPENNRL